MFTLVYCIFLSPREGKFKQKYNQLFQLAEERRKDRGFSLSDGWPVSPVSATLNLGTIQTVCMVLWERVLVHTCRCGIGLWSPGWGRMPLYWKELAGEIKTNTKDMTATFKKILQVWVGTFATMSALHGIKNVSLTTTLSLTSSLYIGKSDLATIVRNIFRIFLKAQKCITLFY